MQQLIRATDVLEDGLMSRHELTRRYTKVYQNVYAPIGWELTARDRAQAAWLWSAKSATVAGLSAAALLGSKWVPADRPPDLVRTQHKSPLGIVIHQDTVADDEVCLVAGMSCTTVARTAYDLGRWLRFEEALIRIDALLNATRYPVDEIWAVAARYPGARNIRRLRQVLECTDAGAESPQESRVRLVLLRGGAPTPQTQIPIRDGRGRVIRRIDMGWPEFKVGVEYDGEQHWTDPINHADDIERLEFLAGLGWRIIRVSARHLRLHQLGIVQRAADALQLAGWTGSLTPRELPF